MPATRALLCRPSPPLEAIFRLNRRSQQANGLIAWWPTLGSRGAGLLRDFAGRFNLAPTAGPTWLADDFGLVTAMDGASSQYWSITNTGLDPYLGASSFTITCWVNRLTTADNKKIWGKVSAGFVGPALRVDTTATLFQYRDSSATARTVSTVALTSGAWALVACIFDADAALVGIQINNRARVTASVAGFTFVSTTQKFTLGQIGSNADYFTGRLADVRIYNRVLTEAEVWRMWDPATRWELYQPALSQVSSTPQARAGGLLPGLSGLSGLVG